jgi:hypothetical protein
MPPRDVALLRARLAAIVKAADRLSADAEDLHAIAYDKPAGDDVKVAGGHPHSAYLDTVGNQRARNLWRRLDTEIHALELHLVELKQATGNLLSEGASPPATRGSKLKPGELARLLGGQRRRQAAGEYTPHRTEAQPKYPGGRPI